MGLPTTSRATDHLEPRRPSVGHPVGQALGVSAPINALRTLDRSSMIYRAPRSTPSALGVHSDMGPDTIARRL